MSEYRVAAAYAKSIIGLAQEQKQLDRVYEDMQLTYKVCADNRAFKNILESPVISNQKKLDILRQIFAGKVSDLTLQFFILIAKKGREPLIMAIAKEFISEYKAMSGIVPVTLYTAVEVDDKIKKEILAFLSQSSFNTNKKLELITKIDPSVIGGFVVNSGDMQFDASVRSKLNKFKNKFTTNPFISKY